MNCACGNCVEGIVIREVAVRSFGEWSTDIGEAPCPNAGKAQPQDVAMWPAADPAAA